LFSLRFRIGVARMTLAINDEVMVYERTALGMELFRLFSNERIERLTSPVRLARCRF
jgi:hypothetical protein